MKAEGLLYLNMIQDPQPHGTFAAVVPTNQYNDTEVIDAMEAYDIVKEDGQEAIVTRWNVLRKESHDGLKSAVKARLCLCGFKENDKPRADSPTGGHQGDPGRPKSDPR